jgi:hypothetical protein
VTFRAKKTAARKKIAGKETTVALHQDMVSYLDALATNDNPLAPLFPSLHGKPSGSHGGLSNAFNRLMQVSQISVPVGVRKEGKGAPVSDAWLSFPKTQLYIAAGKRQG